MQSNALTMILQRSVHGAYLSGFTTAAALAFIVARTGLGDAGDIGWASSRRPSSSVERSTARST